MKQTLTALLLMLALGLLVACDSLAPTAPESQKQPVLQNEAEDTCATCSNPPPPPGGGGGG